MAKKRTTSKVLNYKAGESENNLKEFKNRKENAAEYISYMIKNKYPIDNWFITDYFSQYAFTDKYKNKLKELENAKDFLFENFVDGDEVNRNFGTFFSILLKHTHDTETGELVFPDGVSLTDFLSEIAEDESVIEELHENYNEAEATREAEMMHRAELDMAIAEYEKENGIIRKPAASNRVCCMCGATYNDDHGKMCISDMGCICEKCVNYIHEELEHAKVIEEIEKNEEKRRLNKMEPLNKATSKELWKTCPKPTELKAILDEYVIGQEDAKMTMSTAVYNHYKRIAQQDVKGFEEVEIESSNIVLVGETGTGKTIIIKTLAKKVGVPMVIVDATKYTEAGYVGEDIESMISRLYMESGGDVNLTEHGIIAIDEGDKLGRKSDNPSITRDVSGEGVQQGLLKIIEGSKVLISPKGGRKHPEATMVEIDTKNILFVMMGAFDGIERNIAKRLNTKAVGFKINDDKDEEMVDRKNLLQYITHQDLKSYGLMPELIGRLPVISCLDNLDKEALVKILKEPKNALIKQYQKLFLMDNIKLKFDEDVYEYIAEKALECGLGARGLRSITEAILKDAMFNMPIKKEKKLHIKLDYAKERVEKSKRIKAQQVLNEANKKVD